MKVPQFPVRMGVSEQTLGQKKILYLKYVVLHRDIEKRQRDRKDRYGERWTERGYRERKIEKQPHKRDRKRWK